MKRVKLARRPSAPAPASAMKNRRNGTDRPSFRPASTLRAWRIRMGTRGLFTMTCPSPASVGARMAARMPASQRVSWGKTARAARAPRRMVSSMPVLSSRAGRFRMLFNTCRSVRLASVKSSKTRPTSATRRNTSGLAFRSRSSGRRSRTSMPAAVNTMGAVTTVRSNRAGNQAVEEDQRDKDGQQGHSLRTALLRRARRWACSRLD